MGNQFKVIVCLLIMLSLADKIQSQHQYLCQISDKITNKPIQGATCILIQKKNRKMLGYARSNGFGVIRISADTLKDSIIVWILHKKYTEYNHLIVYDKIATYRDTIALYPQSKILKEVIVTGNKAVTMNGDTVSYVADSFKLPPGASAEELLRKLPGIQVSKDGTIKAQGKKVEKVLVDGDDFFGEDASVATKNLEASMIDKVEVIDATTRKSEATGSDDDKIKIINLKLKDDAKRGYFGKLEQSYSNTNRYNSSQMINVFKGNTKLAGFLIADNMRSRMNWQDMQDLGINNQSWVYDEDLDVWIDKNTEGNVGNTNQVIPQNLKAGTNLNQKFSDGTGVLKARYNYNQSVFDGDQLNRNTSFFNASTQESQNINYVNSKLDKHSAAISIDKDMDSFQKVHVGLATNIGEYNGYNQSRNTILIDSQLVNQSNRMNPFNSKTEAYNIVGEYERKFKKKGRLLGLKTDFSVNRAEGYRWNELNGWTYNKSSDSTIQSINQKTALFSDAKNIKLSATYIEPLFKKGWYLEMGLSMVNARNTSLFNTYNKNQNTNEYDTKLVLLSNNYHYNISAWSEQLKLNYKSKKFDGYIGFKFHQVGMNQDNLDSGDISLHRDFNYLLPSANLTWKYRRNSQLALSFNKSIKPPQLVQIQPFTDNSNPLYITAGNPNLSPTQIYIYRLNNSFWYPVSQTNLWSSITFKVLQNDIVDSVNINENGVTHKYFTQVDGNNNINFNVWYSFHLKKLGLNCSPGFWMSIDNRYNYFNNKKVRTNNIWSSFNLSFDKSIDSLLQSRLEFSLDWNQAQSDNPSFQNTNNLTWKISTTQELELPWNFKIIGDLEYNILPQNAAYSQSQTFTLLTASIERRFLKDNALTARVTVYDILGQNRAVFRSFYQNNFSESFNQALTRYVMLTMIYKFKNKRKQESNETPF